MITPLKTRPNPFHSAQVTTLPRAVLFDYDGVLVASEPIHLSAWMQLLDELHLPRNLDLIKNLVGKTAPEILRRVFLEHRPDHQPTDEELQKLAQRKNEFYIASMTTKLVTFPGVFEGLQWLKQNDIRTAVVSNGRRNELLRTMNHLKLTPFFNEIISRDDARSAKPDPLPYLMGAASLGVSIESCVAIEDSPTGLEAALRAEIPAAAVLTSFKRAELETPVPGLPHLRPFWIGDSIQNFFDWLKTLSK